MYQYQVTSTLTTTHYKNAIEDEQQDEWDEVHHGGNVNGQ